eukprot:TRINITY_DN1681_c0_g1_i7.p1 TRINITY_DN1681_c0_g1~~TRINITY_DN1681_c0_g1_i7.p1  ORF type:complete len:227 (-),score=34.39 TRINITY_DN1681_c0_g1_i7:45-725(-)
MGKVLHGCVSCCSITSAIFLIVSLIVPWYFTFFSATTDDGTTQTLGWMVGWKKIYCFGNICGSDSTTSWGEDAEGDFVHIFNSTLGMMIVAVIFAVVSIVISFIRCCSKHSKPILKIVIIVTLALSLLFTFVSVVYFAVALPKEFCKMNPYAASSGPNTCTNFIGSDTQHGIDTEYSQTASWGGAGWAVAIPALLFTLISLILSAIAKDDHSHHDHDDYSRLNFDT